MENIIEPNETFDFSKLSLAHPVGIQGGAYFTKIEHNKKPLYIQTTKSVTRQGFVKTGKKYYCDLMFDKNSEIMINWFEKLEEKCQKLIFEKGDTWFQNSLEENDIESAFNSILRVYKSGKYYLVRTNVRNNNVTNMPSIKIYDEQERTLSMDDITNDKNIISILEIQGIKFTSRSFQIEIELKQVMAFNDEPIFDSCLIKTNSKNPENLVDTTNKKETLEELEILMENNEEKNNNLIRKDVDSNVYGDNDNSNNLEEELEPIDTLDSNNTNQENIALDIDFEDLNEGFKEEETTTDLKEVNIDFNLENNLETINLKKPDQVYFEFYKEARNKAKIAKKNAILAYLEAKNIKKAYLIENTNDSDSDFDAEIDEVSESELEGL